MENFSAPTTQRRVPATELVCIVEDIAEGFECPSLRPLQFKNI